MSDKHTDAVLKAEAEAWAALSASSAKPKPKRCDASLGMTPWGYDSCDLPKGHAGPHHATNPNRPLRAGE